MYWEKIKNDICVEVLAMNEEGTKMIIRKTVGDKGIHETYMNIYDKLMNIDKNAKWEVHCIRTRSNNSVYYNENKKRRDNYGGNKLDSNQKKQEKWSNRNV